MAQAVRMLRACLGSTAVAVVDPASCRRLPPGEAGEIWLQGPSVALGYWNRSDETRATFQATLAGEADSDFGCAPEIWDF